MTQIDRYMLKRLFVWILVSQTIASFLFIVTQVSRLAPLFAGTEDFLGVCMALMWVQVPVWGWALGPATAIAIFSVAGAMAQRGELVATDSVGISRKRLLRWPVLMTCAILGISTWIWGSAAPQAQQQLRQWVSQSLSGAMVAAILPGQMVSPMENVTMYVDSKLSPGEFQGVVFSRTSFGQTYLVAAQTALVNVSADAAVVRILLRNGDLFHLSQGDDATVLHFGSLAIEVSVRNEIRSKMDFLPDVMAMSSTQLIQRVFCGSSKRFEQFELFRRAAKPMEFGLLALIAFIFAFSRQRKTRTAGFAAVLILFSATYLAARGGEVAMQHGILPPFFSAFMSSLILILGGLFWRGLRRLKNK
ncbi:MAG: LptF/LptG family permease [Deltaproteobacteria bacterium]|nr:LptF/LptG family permease [Deltaproteobacteria bacterium]MBN2673122.1 LptF/LptG family permease [Deltaproteobacteria bacterium]